MGKQKFIELAEIFQSGMILQRDKPIRIWGTSDASQDITVLIGDTTVFQGEIREGDFEISLPKQNAAENQTVAFRNENGDELTLTNIDIGEVWIAGGQSNMEFPLLCERDGDRMIASANDTHFRYYEVGKYAFEGEREENLKDGSRWNNWRTFTPTECTHFSAVATYFALRMRNELRVPVGIVGCAWGGTSASAWIAEDLLRSDSDLHIYTDDYDRATAGQNPEKYLKRDRKNRAFMGNPKNVAGSDMTMKKEVTAPLKFPMKQIAGILVKNQKKNMGPHCENRPGGLYQSMLKKIIGFSARGILFYQGEMDEHHAPLYAKLFTKLIHTWREEWDDDLPFVFVQLAPWGEWMAQDGRNFPELREQQQRVDDQVEGAYLASIMDVGSQYDIHPKIKKPVGERLALLALDEVYGMKQPYAHAPRIAKIVREGNVIRIFFDYAEDGLLSNGNIDSLFMVKQGGKSVPFSSEISGNEVVLRCEGLAQEKAKVAFAYQPYLVMNLKNKGGLPARPSAPIEV